MYWQQRQCCEERSTSSLAASQPSASAAPPSLPALHATRRARAPALLSASSARRRRAHTPPCPAAAVAAPRPPRHRRGLRRATRASPAPRHARAARTVACLAHACHLRALTWRALRAVCCRRLPFHAPFGDGVLPDPRAQRPLPGPQRHVAGACCVLAAAWSEACCAGDAAALKRGCVALCGVRCAGGARLLHGDHGTAREARARCAAPAPPGRSGALRRASLARALTTAHCPCVDSSSACGRSFCACCQWTRPSRWRAACRRAPKKRGKTRVCRYADC